MNGRDSPRIVGSCQGDAPSALAILATALAVSGLIICGTGLGCTSAAGEPATDDAPRITAAEPESTANASGATAAAAGRPSIGDTGAQTAAVTGANLTEALGAKISGTAQRACHLVVDDYELSSAIPTVGIVTWSSASPIDSASVRFGPAETGFNATAPVDLSEPNYRTLILGMKPERDYIFQVVATSAGRTCTSESYTLPTTGPVSNDVPQLTREVFDESLVAPGFILLSAGIGALSAPNGESAPAFIIDHEGDVVWWAPAPGHTSRARMDYEGKNMWTMKVNVRGGVGEMRRISMDGLDVESNVLGLAEAHHDFTAVPNGGVVAIVHRDGCSAVVQRMPDGSLSDIVANVATLYEPAGDCHANSILYHPLDNSFTISDRNTNLFVKFTRQGQPEWQFGGDHPIAPLHFPGAWRLNHGHHLLENGRILFFSNGSASSSAGSSRVYEFQLNTSTGQATEVWSYESSHQSATLGDVQRLGNGNTLVTYSNAGVIQEVDTETNRVVQQFATDSLGYALHRPTLYGPPPK